MPKTNLINNKRNPLDNVLDFFNKNHPLIGLNLFFGLNLLYSLYKW